MAAASHAIPVGTPIAPPSHREGVILGQPLAPSTECPPRFWRGPKFAAAVSAGQPLSGPFLRAAAHAVRNEFPLASARSLEGVAIQADRAGHLHEAVHLYAMTCEQYLRALRCSSDNTNAVSLRATVGLLVDRAETIKAQLQAPKMPSPPVPA
jgi:hypothetical protein